MVIDNFICTPAKTEKSDFLCQIHRDLHVIPNITWSWTVINTYFADIKSEGLLSVSKREKENKQVMKKCPQSKQAYYKMLLQLYTFI